MRPCRLKLVQTLRSATAGQKCHPLVDRAKREMLEPWASVKKSVPPSPYPCLRIFSLPLSASLLYALILYIAPASLQKENRQTHILAEGNSAYMVTNKGPKTWLPGFRTDRTKLLGAQLESTLIQSLKCGAWHWNYLTLFYACLLRTNCTHGQGKLHH